MKEAASLKALVLLHFITPFATGLIFLCATAAAACTLQKTSQYAAYKKSRVLTAWLIVPTLVTVLAEIASLVVHAVTEKGWFPAEHEMLHVLACAFIWGSFFLSFITSQPPAWQPQLCAWLSAAVFESVVYALLLRTGSSSSSSSSHSSRDGAFEQVKVGLGAVRLVLLWAVAFLAVYTVWHASRFGAKTDEETQPLLPKPTDEQANGNGDATQYGSIETANGSANGTANGSASDTATTAKNSSGEGSGGKDDDEEDKEVKAEQQKRIQEQGGYWGYIKSFMIFAPYIWPSGSPKVQMCFGILIAQSIFERFSVVLAPRQLGIIVEKLANGNGHPAIPWKDLFLWTLFRYANTSAGLATFARLARVRVEAYTSKRMKEAAFNHIMNLSMDFHSNKNSGEILQAVGHADALNEVLETVFLTFAPGVIDLLVAVIYITNLLDSYAAFVVFVTTLGYFWLSIKLTLWTVDIRRDFRAKYREQNRRMYEPLGNWLTVAYFNRNPYECQRLSNSITATQEKWIKYYDKTSLVSAARALILSLGFLIVSILACWRLSQGYGNVGTFVNLVTYWAVFISPLNYLSYFYTNISSIFIDAERLLQVMQIKPAIGDKAQAPDLQITDGKVDFDNVGFAYDPRKQTLQDIDFSAAPATTVALCGETGSGKSTILKLLFRFYDVTSGSIKIDGQDLRDVALSSLRQSIGVVPQDPALFNESIMENLKYARLDATDDEVFEACKAAAIHDKILTFPEGYASKVGERGIKLSGGELQRIAIARVLLMNPRIVLLDEATSAVDSTTEALIQEAFRRLSAGRTVFVIAHRLSTICDADMILCIDDGKIIERGQHEDLLALNGKYAELWIKQTKQKEKGSKQPSKVNSSAASVAGDEAVEVMEVPLITLEEPPEERKGRTDDEEIVEVVEAGAVGEEPGPGPSEGAEGKVGSGRK